MADTKAPQQNMINIIEAKDLHYTYPGSSTETLRGLDFSIHRGEIFGFLGPSGAGKSTTQNILIGLLGEYAGEIRINGSDPARKGGDYYETIGVSFEQPNLFNRLSGRENLEFFSALYRGETASPDSLLSMVDLSEAADKQVRHYSKGMKMRLNFCRAFLNRPELVFLDEPTSGQDPVNARTIKDIIRTQKEEGTTVFLTTHDMHVAAELCDRVAFIVNGEIKLIDAPRELMLKRGEKKVRVEYRNSGKIEEQDFPLDALASDPAFLEALRTRQIETIHSREASLEDIFIEVTGHSLGGNLQGKGSHA